MKTYIAEILQISQNLADIGEPIENVWISLGMINGVNEKYDTLINSVFYGKDKTKMPSSEEYKLLLFSKSERRRLESIEETIQNLLLSIMKGEKKTLYYKCGYYYSFLEWWLRRGCFQGTTR